jgi:Major intrinsic protein
MIHALTRRFVSEFFGTSFLVAAVVGSEIMAEHLANGNAALALLANTIATGAALVALILAFGPISGAQMNPVVSSMDALEGGLRWKASESAQRSPCHGISRMARLRHFHLLKGRGEIVVPANNPKNRWSPRWSRDRLDAIAQNRRGCNCTTIVQAVSIPPISYPLIF